MGAGEGPIRAAEVIGALSIATDLGTGQPLEHAMRTAVLAVRLGELAGASARSSPTPTTSRCCTPPAAPRTGTRPRSSSATTSRTGPPSTSSTRPTPPRCSSSTAPMWGSAGPRRCARRWSRPRSPGRPEGPRGVRDDVRGRAALRGLARPAPEIQERSSTSSRAGTGAASRPSAGDAIPLPMRLLHVARDASLFLSAGGPKRRARSSSAGPARPTSRAWPSSP